MVNSKSSIRKQMVAARAALSPKHRDEAALGLARNARQYAPLMRAARIASYVPVRGEISPHYLLKSMRLKRACIPVICDLKAGLMMFCRADVFLLSNPKLLYAPNVKRNEYGIPEPSTDSRSVETRSLDVVLVPLAAFDRTGNRLGLGAGFYDRAFEYRLWNRQCTRPLLVGIAHDFQEVEQLDTAPWDVPLDVIITPKELLRF
jgi:5-formyltetrahydrofolate cyclo-ligase